MIDIFLKMTWGNPIFMIVAIGAIWFVPGIVIRRLAEERYKASKQKAQAKKIASLYPPKNE